MIMRLLSVFERSGHLLLEFLPYIVAGVLLTEILKYTPWMKLVRKSMSNSPVLSVVMASVLGTLSPLCTYGTIPIVIMLHRGGVSLAPLLTFLSASSLMNPQLFLTTWGGLGLEFAAFRLVWVLVFTLMLGAVIVYIEKAFSNTSKQAVHRKFKRTETTEKDIRSFSLKVFLRGAYGNLEFVGFYIVTGMVLSTLLDAFVPLSSILENTNRVEWLNVLAASVLGIPLYACGGATIPLVSTLLDNGMSAGAAMAFFIVGPGTRITPLLALGSFLSPKMLASYVIALLLFSIATGMLINTGLGFL
jgi:uncharacterized membrane protein YraQ (UPF0718 family)